MPDHLTIFIPVVLGCIGVFILMPRVRSHTPRWFGAALGAIAIGYAGVFLIRRCYVPVEAVLFYVFAFLAIFAAGMMITQHNPVHAALSFALVVLSTCGLFLLQQAPFLMAATIIVYAGAIIVTFLFVIMLAQQAGLSNADLRSREPLLACLAGFVLLGGLLYILGNTFIRRDFDSQLARLHSASKCESVAEMKTTLVDPEAFFKELMTRTKELPSSNARRVFEGSVSNAQEFWSDWLDNPETLRFKLGEMAELGAHLRIAAVQVPPSEGVKNRLSAMSASSGNEQVAQLGRTLYTDYLLAIQLAGTLLLVATVGAIAITARKTEVAR